MPENICSVIAGPDLWTRLANETRPLVVYGMGNGADKLWERLAKIGKEPAAVFASDDFVRGQTFRGYTVKCFSDIIQEYPDPVILMSFATHQPDVMAHVYSMAERYTFYLPDMPVAGDLDFNAGFWQSHARELQQVYELLEDNLSRQIFSSVLSYKYTGDIGYLKDAHTRKEEELFCFAGRSIKTALDGGAYTGDTLREMLADFPDMQTIIAVEPDPKNFKKLTKNTADIKSPCKIELYEAALWSTSGEAVFMASGNRNSTFSYASHKHQEKHTSLVTVDELMADRMVDYLKYDVEGAEKEAVLGSQRTIKRCRPILGVSLYHRTEDLYVLPILLKNMCPEYRFYIRRRPCLPAWEMMLYAI